MLNVQLLSDEMNLVINDKAFTVKDAVRPSENDTILLHFDKKTTYCGVFFDTVFHVKPESEERHT